MPKKVLGWYLFLAHNPCHYERSLISKSNDYSVFFIWIQTKSEYVNITIRQKPSADKAFGFSLKGGKTKQEPVMVEAVIVGEYPITFKVTSEVVLGLY